MAARTNLILVQCKPNSTDRQALFCADKYLPVFSPCSMVLRQMRRPNARFQATSGLIRRAEPKRNWYEASALGGSCGREGLRFEGKVLVEGVGRMLLAQARQALDELVDNAGRKRHQARIGDRRKFRREIA